jgi:sphinganine-1-phosphate aldolase
MQFMGSKCVVPLLRLNPFPLNTIINISGYLESCRSIVTCARTIANAITNTIPELYVLGSPPSSVIAFASKDATVNALEVGDAMFKRGWHLNALSGPAAVHIACTVSIPVFDVTFVFIFVDLLLQTETNDSCRGCFYR